MILNLKVRNWRAFDYMDLELGPGTTFIVASNGVGKTSLMMAAAWGVFGDASGVNASEERRGDADSASVEVLLHLPVSGSMEIRRRIDQRERSQVEARLGGRVLSNQAEIEAVLSEELGADLHTLARLTFMAHGGSLETTEGEFDLRGHLSNVFGAAPLLDAAASASQVAKDAASAIRRVKAARKVERSERDSLVGEIAALDEQMEIARATRAAADRALALAQQTGRLAEAWIGYEVAMRDRANRLAELIQSIGDLLTAPNVRDVEQLTTLVEKVEATLASRERHIATLRAKVSLQEESAIQLRRAEAVCPTCLRPLSPDELEAAVSEHDRQLVASRTEVSEEEEAVEDQRLAAQTGRATLVKIQTLPEPVRPEKGAPDVTNDMPSLDKASREAREAESVLAELGASRRIATDKVREMDDDERRTADLVGLIRQESVAIAAAAALGSAADAITTDRIEPLVGEVGRRWKRVFGMEGLRLSPTGRITLSVGTRELPFSSLSGGEKVWAMLLTRLLVTSASTYAPFVWLDEPLEHLDPRLRRIVAGTLARASQSDGLRQVVVTTYESEIARQLMEDVPSASLLYVRSSD